MSAPESKAAYPEHDKLSALNGANQTVGDFIEWLSEAGIVPAKYHDDRDFLYPILERRDDLIAKFFDIDQGKLEAEKRAMLESLRTGGQP